MLAKPGELTVANNNSLQADVYSEALKHPQRSIHTKTKAFSNLPGIN